MRSHPDAARVLAVTVVEQGKLPAGNFERDGNFGRSGLVVVVRAVAPHEPNAQPMLSEGKGCLLGAFAFRPFWKVLGMCRGLVGGVASRARTILSRR